MSNCGKVGSCLYAGIVFLAALASISLFGCGGGSGGGTPALIAGFPAGFPDTTRPLISDISPGNAEVGVTLNSAISVSFSEPMTAASLQPPTLTVKETVSGAAVSGTVSVSGAVATFVPSAPLSTNTQFTVTVTTAARDLSKNAMAADFSWNFTTGIFSDTTPPTVSATSPANNGNGISTNSSITATFSEAMTNASLNASTFTVTKQNGPAIAGIVDVNGNTVRITPAVALTPSAAYVATISSTVADAAGNPLGTDYSWSFTTAVAPDTTPPIVTALSPSNSALGVALNASITATFSEAMTNSTLNTASFIVKPTAGGAALAGAVNVTGNTARFTAFAGLAGSTQYTATITTSALDAAGNALAADFSWRFTTAAAPDTRPPTVALTSPANLATGVALDSPISATFSKPMKISTLNTANFKVAKTIGGATVAGTVNVIGNTATFTPLANLDPTTQYTATITTGVQDAAGNALAANFTWAFLTAASDTTPPTVFTTLPVGGATGVDVSAPILVTFTKLMNNATLTTASFKLATSPGGAPVAGTVSVTGTTATFTQSANLAPGTYTATITTAAQDAAGNSLAANFVWSFTTAAAPDTTATLAWDAVVDPSLVGYRVYYGTAPGTYTQPLGSGIIVGNVLTYTITGLTIGTRYYFAVTAYGSSNESVYSNEVFKDIP